MRELRQYFIETAAVTRSTKAVQGGPIGLPGLGASLLLRTELSHNLDIVGFGWAAV